MSSGVVHVTVRHRCPDGEDHRWTIGLAYRYVRECRTDRHGDPGWPEELDIDEIPDTCARCGQPLPAHEMARLSEEAGTEVYQQVNAH